MKVNHRQRLRWIVPLVLFMMTIIDAALPAIFPRAFLGSGQVIISHLTLYFIVLFAFYFRDSNILLWSVIAGLFHDSYNTTFLGLYATLYFLISYIVLKTKQFFPKSPLVFYMLFIVLVTLLDFVVFIFYTEILDYASLSVLHFLVNRLGPTLIFTTVMCILLYLPSRNLLRWLGYESYIIF